VDLFVSSISSALALLTSMLSYTLEARLHGEWEEYHFTLVAGGTRVHTKPTYGLGAILPVAEARRLYASLLRKGWRPAEPLIWAC
jgi:hypothetical protein